MTDLLEYLTGPWQAVLVDKYGWVHASVDDAVVDALEDDVDDDEFEILIVRGAARPHPPTGGRMPGIYSDADVALRDDDFLLVNDRIPAEGGAVHLARARAMADGLNAAAAKLSAARKANA